MPSASSRAEPLESAAYPVQRPIPRARILSKRENSMKSFAAAGFVLFVVSSAMGQAIRGRDGITLPTSPPVNADPVSDNYSGTGVVDNYRWIEDAKSTATRAFIHAENVYT